MARKALPGKYIVINNTYAVAFNPNIEHFDKCLGRCATSAGFFEASVVNGEFFIECFGESDSLGGLKSRPQEDAALLKGLFDNCAAILLDRLVPVLFPDTEDLRSSESGDMVEKFSGKCFISLKEGAISVNCSEVDGDSSRMSKIATKMIFNLIC